MPLDPRCSRDGVRRRRVEVADEQIDVQPEAFGLEDAAVGGDHQGAVGNRGQRGARGTSRTDDDRGPGHRSLRQHYLGQVRGSPAR
jgi:hypothetical protein